MQSFQVTSPPHPRISTRVIAGIASSLLLLVALVALLANEDGSSTNTSHDTSMFWNQRDPCPGPVWSKSMTPSLPKVDYPKDTLCNSGLWADHTSESIRSFEISLSTQNKHVLDSNPKAETYVPCNFTINYVPPAYGGSRDDALTIYGAKCRYKGSVGSFGSCTDAKGALPPPSQNRTCKLSWKVNMKDALKQKRISGSTMIMEGTTVMQFSGMSGDPSALRTPLGYTMLNDAGFVAPCSKPVNIYVNGDYQGIYANTENTDAVMLHRRAKLLGDKGHGLYKEVWPITTDPAFYENPVGVPGLSNPKRVKGTGDKSGKHLGVFANVFREAADCVARGNEHCTKERATEILEKYVDTQSYVNALVGLALTGNWDSILYQNHNYLTYITSEAKLYYVAWDLDQTLAASIEGNYWFAQGWASHPWYYWNFTSFEYENNCMHDSDPGGNFQKYGQFACNPVNNLMARALKERFFQTYTRVIGKVKALAKQHLARWEAQISPGLTCAYADGYWPSIETQQTALYGLTPPAAMGPNTKFNPDNIFSTTTSLMQWFEYFEEMWTALGKGHKSAWVKPVWPQSTVDKYIMGLPEAKAGFPFCLAKAPNSPIVALSQAAVCGPQCFFAPVCLKAPDSPEGRLCLQHCSVYFQGCVEGTDNCDWLLSEMKHTAFGDQPWVRKA